MLEIYLFINPLGSVCYQTEQDILNLVARSSERINFRFIPLLNLNTVTSVMQSHRLPLNDLNIRNQMSDSLYQAALDYKAALFQGKKKGRAYLLYIQHAFLNSKSSYDEELVLAAAKACKLDVAMFMEDRHSDFTVKCFRQDQEMAAKMHVSEHPTLVLYNLEGFDCGVSVSGCDSYDVLENIVHGNVPRELILQHHIKQRLHPIVHSQQDNDVQHRS
ncbi:DsbA family protein [Ligilactobacillus sp. WILCCON 0076]|uniref:DsbA family protein n=1 Tax=Ligilactobacillus ubinensis TaxID=2876789 RepID=A0A9X2JP78_9LACO|nr:ClpXP adapter SpxH family protein [Ligilactobacillus ubinensis]MCP0887746.1 DsbA family protein [Ligilactobacillus ubinensis]